MWLELEEEFTSRNFGKKRCGLRFGMQRSKGGKQDSETYCSDLRHPLPRT